MNATRANAADKIAKAVKNVAATAGRTEPQPVPEQPARLQPATVPAAVLYASHPDAHPFSVEIEGKVFTPARDQAEERRCARLEEIGRQLDALVGEPGAALLGEFEQLWASRVDHVHDYVLRQVGFALSENGRLDLWRLIYAQLGPDDDRYRPNAAATFLYGDNIAQDRNSA